MTNSKVVLTVGAVCKTNIAPKGEKVNMLLTKFDDIIFNRPALKSMNDFSSAIQEFALAAHVKLDVILDFIESAYDLSQRGKISADVRGSVKGGKLTKAKMDKIAADNIADSDFQAILISDGIEAACKAFAEDVTYGSLGDEEADRIHDESKRIRKESGELPVDFQA